MALSDESLLDRKRLPFRSPFVARSAGNALAQLTQDLLPGIFDTTGVQDVDVLATYSPDPQKTWLQHAVEIALEVRGSYRAVSGALLFAPAGAAAYALNETDGNFSPDGLKLAPADGLINDVTVVGEIEPQAYVKDYFVGDGLTLKFYLSQTPFTKSSTTVFDEEYTGRNARCDAMESDRSGERGFSDRRKAASGGRDRGRRSDESCVCRAD